MDWNFLNFFGGSRNDVSDGSANAPENEGPVDTPENEGSADGGATEDIASGVVYGEEVVAVGPGEVVINRNECPQNIIVTPGDSPRKRRGKKKVKSQSHNRDNDIIAMRGNTENKTNANMLEKAGGPQEPPTSPVALLPGAEATQSVSASYDHPSQSPGLVKSAADLSLHAEEDLPLPMEQVLSPIQFLPDEFNSGDSTSVDTGARLLQGGDEGMYCVETDDDSYQVTLPTEGAFCEETSLPDCQVENDVGGCCFKQCNINRLKRFIIIGSEQNFYDAGENDAGKKVAGENINCVKKLLEQGCYEDVLKIIVEYSKSGRVVKECPLLSVLALCVEGEFQGLDELQSLEVRKKAYMVVSVICDIPTKLFRFLDLRRQIINKKREENPPIPQKVFGKKSEKRSQQPVVSSEDAHTHVIRNSDKKVNTDGKVLSGWGRLPRKYVSEFYLDEEKSATRLLYLLTKYKRRYKLSHKLVLRHAHPKWTGAKGIVLRYITGGFQKAEEMWNNLKPPIDESTSEVIQWIKIIEEVQNLRALQPDDNARLLEILEQYGRRSQTKEHTRCSTIESDAPKENVERKVDSIQIVREHIHNGFLENKAVWEALFRDMPMKAMISNIGKMSKVGVFEDENNVAKLIRCLTDEHKLKTARVHPIKILVAKTVYESGTGEKGKLAWAVNPQIVQALEDAFHLSFKQPEYEGGMTYKTGKRFMLCLDVSTAMNERCCVGCKTMTPAMASAAMALLTWNIEEDVEIVAFGGAGNIVNLKDKGFDKEMRMKEMLDKIVEMDFGTLDCALPMVYARENKLTVDVFLVYSNSQPYYLALNPSVELEKYNKEMNCNAKLIVCSTDSTGFTIADPRNPNMLDIAGFDTYVPELIYQFSMGELSGLCDDRCVECRPR